MKILGMEIKHPSVKELAGAALLIVMVAGVWLFLVALNFISPEAAWTGMVGSTTGFLLSAFGVSLTKYGWRAVVVMAAFSFVIFLLVVH